MIPVLIAGTVGLLFTLLLTPAAIRLFSRIGWGQPIRIDGPASHEIKRGIPTMGGLVFIAGTLLGYLVAHLAAPRVAITPTALLFLLMLLGHAAVGFLDDHSKVTLQDTRGISGRQKLIGQGVVTTVFAVLALQFPDPRTGLTPASSAISFTRDISWLDLMALGPVVGWILVILWMNLLTMGASNGVNLTDGQDGLTAGAVTASLVAYSFISFFQAGQSCRNAGRDLARQCFEVRDPLDLMVVATALAGSLVGFLWWNARPARIIMGDTGALGLGGALAALAILTRTELLLIVIGGLFCMVTMSVILQRGFFKLTKGRRLFRMAPLHHHFELGGWAEITITIRFWIVAGLCMALGVGIFYAVWLGS